MGNFFSIENKHKAGWWLIFLLAGMIIPTIISGFTTTGQNITQGKQAYDRVMKVETQIDSMQKTCAKERQSNALFQQEMRQEVRYVKDGQQEMKSDLKDIKLILMQKK